MESHCGLHPRPIPGHSGEVSGVGGDGDVGDVGGGDGGVGYDDGGGGENLPQRAPSVQWVHCTLSKGNRQPEQFDHDADEVAMANYFVADDR